MKRYFKWLAAILLVATLFVGILGCKQEVAIEKPVPIIVSVTIANAGEGYTGKLPVTIIGENLKGYVITCSDSSFGNVNYVSDNMIKATVKCNGIVGENTITVTCGTSSATGTVKVVAAEKSYSVGDILFTDGTRIKAENLRYGIPDNQLDKAFAVIASAPYGGGVGKAVGLSSDYLKWAPEDTTGYSTKFTGIQADYSGDSSSGYTFSGDIDGSDNWEYICSIDPEGTKDSATNYPAFNFALTYGIQAGLTGTEYETGWYVPSVAELYDVYTNKEVVQTSLNAVGGFTLGTSWYWSSSQYDSYTSSAYIVFSNSGYVNPDGKRCDNRVFVLQAFNANQFNDYSSSSNITSVTIANAGEGYVGELTVTIIGENLKGHAITSNDASFGNVNYVSDTKVTATFVYDGTNNTITVTSGTSKASGTVKVVAAEKCYSVGDILFTDGTRIKAENLRYGIPDNQLDKAFAVIASAPYGGGVGKAVGLQKSSDYLEWAPNGTTGYSTNFTGIQADYSTFTGDIDGSDNWEYICSIDPEGTKDPATNYPAFNFALTYGTQAGLTGTEYENGWYVPSVAELYDVYTNKEVVQTSLNAVCGFTLETSWYWSSSQHVSNYGSAFKVGFNASYVVSSKSSSSSVFVLQAFNAEQFNNYEYTPTITSVTVANAGEGYVGELPVTIIGENLKYNGITCSDSSFGNVNYVSDTKVTATFVYDGTNNTITVTSGTSSASGTVKVVAEENCFSVGDILFTDGTRIKAEKVQYGVPDSQVDKAFAVIASVSYGGAAGKAVGLSSDYLKWAPGNTTGYSTNFTGIQASRSGDSSSGYTFSGDIEGSDNWEYICSIDPEGTQDAANNYPAFNFALTYGIQAGLTGTEYETGWYVPSVAELYDVYTNRGTVQNSLNAVGGFTLGTSDYWSSSQDGSGKYYAYLVAFVVGGVYDGIGKNYKYSVFVLQAFNAEQFN